MPLRQSLPDQSSSASGHAAQTFEPALPVTWLFRYRLCSEPQSELCLPYAGELEAAGTKLNEAEAELASKHALIQSLEEDLLAAQKGANTVGEPCSVSAKFLRLKAPVAEAACVFVKEDCVADMWHVPASTEAPRLCAGNGKMPNGQHASEAAALLSEDAGTEEDSGQQTMVRVICSQRDRLKERVNQLGDELSKAGALLQRGYPLHGSTERNLKDTCCDLLAAMNL